VGATSVSRRIAPERPVVITGHAQSKYGVIIQVLNACREAKLNSISFAAAKRDK